MLRAAMLIDGSNLHMTCKMLNHRIDFARLRTVFDTHNMNVVVARYYTAVLNQDNTANKESYNSLRKMTDWLTYNDYSVVTKESSEYTSETGVHSVKGNMDVEIAVDAMELAPKMDVIILLSGDGDFIYVGKMLQQKGLRFHVVSSLKAGVINASLRRQADLFIELADILPNISLVK